MIIDKSNEARDAYIDKVTGFVNLPNLRPLKIVINSGNGAAGPAMSFEPKIGRAGIKQISYMFTIIRIPHSPMAFLTLCLRKIVIHVKCCCSGTG